MKKYLVSANEMLYYLTKEIEAKNKEEAKEKYLEMIEKGDAEVNESEIVKVEVRDSKLKVI